MNSVALFTIDMEYVNGFVDSFKRKIGQYLSNFRENASRGLKRRLEDLKNDGDDFDDASTDMYKPRRYVDLKRLLEGLVL